MRFHRPRSLDSVPTVSVVIPCYNYGRFLPQAVAGALEQQGVDVDVLIVDDASTDDSAHVARALASADPRVQVLEHKVNAGHIQTYNDGLAQARGDYVTLVSADDVVAPHALSRAAALMEHHPAVGLVYGFARSFTDEPAREPSTVRNWSVYPGSQWLQLAARRGRCFVVSPEAVMRRQALIEVGDYDARLPHSADFHLWLRTAARWDVARVNGCLQASYRVHTANMHLTTYSGWLTDLEERFRTFSFFVQEEDQRLDAREELRDLFRRALAREALRRAHTARTLSDRDLEMALREFASRVRPGTHALGAWRPTGRVAHHVRWRYERRYGT